MKISLLWFGVAVLGIACTGDLADSPGTGGNASTGGNAGSGAGVPDGPGAAALTWSAPTTNADGSPLTDLAGYRVYHGTNQGVYEAPVDIGKVTTFQLTGLAASTTHYFTVTALDTSGNESAPAMEVSKEIP